MAVAVTTSPDVNSQTLIPLFQAPPNVIVGDVNADGRFLLVQSGAAPFTVVLGWMKN